MKSFLFIYLSILTFVCQGQLVRIPITHTELQNQHYRIATSNQDTLKLPFWDDFSTSDGSPDTLKWVDGSDVFINATLAQNPPTYRVATFDGLSRTGLAHNIDSEERGATDSLISLPIDLSIANRNTTFLSFYWQSKGNGEIPEEVDSLVLYFFKLSPDETGNSVPIWERVWSQAGGAESVSDQFEQEILKLDSSGYFHSEFQFKFVSYGGKTGPFDTWHIDYVYLNEDRNSNDTFYFDRSLSGNPSALFDPYSEIPSKHFYQDPLAVLSRQSVLATNLDNLAHNLEYFYTLRVRNTETIIDSVSLGNGGLGLHNALDFLEIFAPSNISMTLLDEPDSLVLESSFFYQTGEDNANFESPVDVSVNDQIKTQYLLQDHYAYDDGSAEFAAGINISRGQLAVKFDLLLQDTLTHLDIYFPNITPSSVGESITLLVWDDLSSNGVLLTQEGYLIEPPSGLNEFTRIQLNQSLLVRDSVFIGFQQFTDNYIGIGFDRNNTSAGTNIYTNTKGNWTQNTSISGAMMIRPVFGYDSAFVEQPLNVSPSKQIYAYPNPTSGILSIDGEHHQIQLFTLSGQMVYQSTRQSSYDLHLLDEGVYIARIVGDHMVKTQKIIIRK